MSNNLPDWTGATAVILGCGPSLSLAQIRYVALARLGGTCRVICVKDTIFAAWGWADWLHWDQHLRTMPRGFSTELPPGLRTFVARKPVPGSAWRIPVLGFAPIPPLDLAGIAPKTTGGEAIALAALAGATRILLLGFDATCRGHFFGWREGEAEGDGGADYSLVRELEMLAEPLRARGVEVINCSPGTASTCFRREPLEEALKVTLVTFFE